MTQTTNDDERMRAVIREYAALTDPGSQTGLDPDRVFVIHLLSHFAPGTTQSYLRGRGHVVSGRVGGAVVSVRVDRLRAVLCVIASEALAEPMVAEGARALDFLPYSQHVAPEIQPWDEPPVTRVMVTFLSLRPEHVAWILTRLPELNGEYGGV